MEVLYFYLHWFVFLFAYEILMRNQVLYVRSKLRQKHTHICSIGGHFSIYCCLSSLVSLFRFGLVFSSRSWFTSQLSFKLHQRQTPLNSGPLPCWVPRRSDNPNQITSFSFWKGLKRLWQLTASHKQMTKRWPTILKLLITVRPLQQLLHLVSRNHKINAHRI